MPLILYIDTSGAKSHSLLFDEHAIHAERLREEVNVHAKMLNVHIEEMLKEKNWAWQQIGAVMVMNGPGSYTGLRISLANAKGYCYALDIPLILISQFDLMRASISSDDSFSIFILKARENEFFVNYSEKGKEVNRIMTYEDLKQLVSTSKSILYSTDSSLADEFFRN
ncbi:MAG: peptidase M22 glycoprotease [Bacteroidetes bacterium OLB11]|nr:MAG: peptidase M22 glycoprotease [Bacteroidetes bacterium OLB11]